MNNPNIYEHPLISFGLNPEGKCPSSVSIGSAQTKSLKKK